MFSALLAGCLTEPELHNASVHGFKLKPWEFYPTLVPWNAEDTVHGMYWQAEYERQVALLQRYETHIHKTTACSINVEKGKSSIEDGLTFVWAGDPASSELKDGEVLLEKLSAVLQTRYIQAKSLGGACQIYLPLDFYILSSGC